MINFEFTVPCFAHPLIVRRVSRLLYVTVGAVLMNIFIAVISAVSSQSTALAWNGTLYARMVL